MENRRFILAEVVSLSDDFDGGRIKARVLPNDRGKSISQIPYAFPLLPKMINIRPKIGESVFIITSFSDADTQRFYIGPIISQANKIFKDYYGYGSANMLDGGVYKPSPSQKENNTAKGCLLKDDEIGIIGRKNSQIILSDNDIRIRCGVSVLNQSTSEFTFNKLSPSFLKLKYYENNKKFKDQYDRTKEVGSVATLVADEINLISNTGNPCFNLYDKDESISDEEMQRIIANAHLLPYGDKLCELLLDLIHVFENHEHQYGPSKPNPLEPTKVTFNKKYGSTLDSIKKVILSNNIRIN